MRHETTRGYQRGGDENDEGKFFLQVGLLETRSKYESRTDFIMFCLQGKWNCHYNLQSDCFAYPCAGTNYAWALSRAHVMRDNEESENVIDLSQGKCI